jgi:hypothetical protein
MKQEFMKQQDDLIKNITSRGSLILEVVKLIVSLLEGNIKNQTSIMSNYSSFNKKISKIDICMKGRILEVAKHYNVSVSSKSEELKKLVAKFSKLKAEIQKKFSALLKSLTKKKKEVEASRLEFSKIQNLKDDFVLQRYLACNRKAMHDREVKFQTELMNQTKEIMALDAQIVQEFDKILHELDKKKVSTISNWNPLKSYNQKALEEYFNQIPTIKQHIVERIAFADKKCSKMQLYTIFGDKVYCFSVVTGSNMEKMSEKYNFRPELQAMAGHTKHNVHYFESKTPVFCTSVSKVDLISVGINGFIKIKVPSSKWYKKMDKMNLYFRDLDEMSEFMEAFGLEVPGKITGRKKRTSTVEEVSSKEEKKSSKAASAQELEAEFLSQEEKEGRVREDSEATLKNEAIAA